ncbi:MAG TPA: tetratricopeptide repeat protein [Pirellulales bacterium]|jgi:Flp pilus assembly protein TadD|nr:tetratricopeptide repeat protein [Pirellulales bacterium]
MPRSKIKVLLDRNANPRADAYYVWGVCGFLLFVVAVIYGQTLDFILLAYDDNGFVHGNPHVTAGLTGEGIRWAFTEGPYGEWYPFSALSHMLDCQFFGLNAWGHHLTSVLLHAAGSIALFLVLRQMTGELWPSAFVAVLFAVHPQHVESVAWVSERRDVLSGLFFMFTLGAWLGYVRHGRSLGRYLLVVLLFACGLMSKPMLVTLPFLLLLLDYWPLAQLGRASDAPGWTASIERPSLRRLVGEVLPLVVLAGADCLMTLRTHYAAGKPLAWSERIGNAAISCVAYFAQFFCPVDLAAVYPFLPGGSPAWKVAGALAIVCTVSAAAVIWRRGCPYLFVGWFWFLGMLCPVLELVRVADHARADRYMYLPGIGLCIAVAWGASRLVARLPWGRWIAVGAAALVIPLLVVGATRQTSFWYDDETLWTHALECTSDNEIANLGLGHAIAQQGRLDEAIAFYQAALAVNPDSYNAHVYLGSTLSRFGRFKPAAEHLHRAIEIQPHGASAYLGLGHMLVYQGKYDEARDAFERVIAIEPNSSAAYNDLGSAFFLEGKIDESIPRFEAALAMNPMFVLARTNLAAALAAQGRLDDAISHYRQALKLDPNNPEARSELEKLQRQHPSQPDPPPGGRQSSGG